MRLFAAIVLLSVCGLMFAQQLPAGQANKPGPAAANQEQMRSYIIGAGDQVALRVMDMEELSEKQFQVDGEGYLHLPTIGRVRAAGLTTEQLSAELVDRLKVYLVHPDVSISVAEFRSQPVSVLGAVKTPGVLQVQGRKTLVEMLSMAGGLDTNAGPTVKITRRKEWGPIPLRSATYDPTTGFSVAEVNLKSILEAKNPEENLLVMPYDVISVPRAEMVYVVGEVQRAGGFALTDRGGISVLKALSLAGGLEHQASPQHAKILRSAGEGGVRTEYPLDLNKMLAGKAPDFQMRPEDVLFIPSSAPKRAAGRVAEAAIQAATGIAIFGKY